MDSPQLDNGYVKIANEIMDALINYRIPGEQMQCLLFIIRKTYGFNKKWDTISNSQFVEFTGLKKSSVCRAINSLVDKNIVHKKANNYIPSYYFNKRYNSWKVLAKKLTVSKKVNRGVTKKRPTKDSITKDIYRSEFKFKIKTPIPANIFLTDRMRDYAKKQGCENSGHAEQLFEDFKTHHGAKGTKWQDWTLAFFKWIRNDKKFYNPDKYMRITYD